MLRPGERSARQKKAASKREKQLIRKGMKGPTKVALKKTVLKKTIKNSKKVAKMLKPGEPFIELLAKKGMRESNKIAVFHALNAAGLDPKNASHAKARAKIHKLMQEQADLSAEVQAHPAMTPEDGRTKAMELLPFMMDSFAAVCELKGQEGVERFCQAISKHSKAVDGVHKELKDDLV